MNPEQIQTQERATAAAKFSEAMLSLLRKRLFAGISEREWFEHRAIGQIVGGALRGLQAAEARDITQALAAGAGVLRSKGGRRKKSAGIQGDLFQ